MARGFVLAGGHSRRFGSDKALHPVEGVPMAARVARAMEDAGLEPWFVARDRRLDPLGWPTLLEPDQGPRHPLVGTILALERWGEPALFSPCDLPFLEAEALVRLMAGPAPRLAEGNPLLAWLGPESLPALRALVERQGPARAIPGERVQVEARCLVNLNQGDSTKGA